MVLVAGTTAQGPAPWADVCQDPAIRPGCKERRLSGPCWAPAHLPAWLTPGGICRATCSYPATPQASLWWPWPGPLAEPVDWHSGHRGSCALASCVFLPRLPLAAIRELLQKGDTWMMGGGSFCSSAWTEWQAGLSDSDSPSCWRAGWPSEARSHVSTRWHELAMRGQLLLERPGRGGAVDGAEVILGQVWRGCWWAGGALPLPSPPPEAPQPHPPF